MIMKISTRVISNIHKEKLRLIQKAKTKWIYENFWQKEVNKFIDKYVNISDYGIEMNIIRDSIQEFNNWCMNFCW